MATFPNSSFAEPMLSSVAEAIKDIETDDIDIHTITLILGQHGEFDLVVEAGDASDGFLEDRRWEGIAHRYGGVTGFEEALPDGPAELTTRNQRERYAALVDHVGHEAALRDARKW